MRRGGPPRIFLPSSQNNRSGQMPVCAANRLPQEPASSEANLEPEGSDFSSPSPSSTQHESALAVRQSQSVRSPRHRRGRGQANHPALQKSPEANKRRGR